MQVGSGRPSSVRHHQPTVKKKGSSGLVRQERVTHPQFLPLYSDPVSLNGEDVYKRLPGNGAGGTGAITTFLFLVLLGCSCMPFLFNRRTHSELSHISLMRGEKNVVRDAQAPFPDATRDSVSSCELAVSSK